MEVNKFNELTEYLIEILSAALHDRKPAEKPNEFDWGQIFNVLHHAGVSGLAYYAIENLDEDIRDSINPEILSKWKETRNRTFYNRMHFDVEREMILSKMEENHISYMLLKGILLQDYYPKPGMRTMSDNDILYGYVDWQDSKAVPKDLEQAEAKNIMIEAMEGLGYEYYKTYKGVEEFYKKPIFNFELHRYLDQTNAENFSYYENSWKKAVQSKLNPYSYYLPDEDEYIFLVNHAAKHHDHGGCGFRFLLDIYVFLQKKGEKLNWEYIIQELRLLDIYDFECEMRELSLSAFSDSRILNKIQLENITKLISSGLYGTEDSFLEARMNSLTKNSKRRKLTYILRRIYPSKEFYEDNFPKLSKIPVMIPFLVLYRFLKGMVIHPNRLWKELKLFIFELLRKK